MIHQSICHLAKVLSKKQIESDSFLRVFTGSEFQFDSSSATMYSGLMKRNTYIIENPAQTANRLNGLNDAISFVENHWRLDRQDENGSQIRAIIFVTPTELGGEVDIFWPFDRHEPTLKEIQFVGGFLY